jgi:signal transduction histidine kinase
MMGIGNRLRLLVLILILGIFSLIMISFNLLVRQYILGNVRSQLEQAQTAMYSAPPRKIPFDGTARDGVPLEPLLDFRFLPGDRLAQGEIFILNKDYDLLYPDGKIPYRSDFDDFTKLARMMKERQVDLNSTEIQHIQVDGKEYYLVVSSFTGQTHTGLPNFMVYSIDMSAITNFAKLVNMVLLLVMAIATIAAVISTIAISNRIAKPIVELTSFANRIGNGDFTRIERIYRDRELVELAESMNKAAIQLDTYDSEQKTFFQNVSHELRTPLQTIKCNAEGIEHGILNQIDASKTIIGETNELANMVEDLLYLSRMDSSLPSQTVEPYDLRELLSNCAQRMHTLADERKLHFIYDFDDDPVLVKCDADSLVRAFNNILSNAVRFAATTITLSCRTMGNHVAVAVVDDGPGIAPGDVGRIFDRFYKGSGGLHGIGLSIAKSVVAAHHGTIGIQQPEHGGTAFIITLPL